MTFGVRLLAGGSPALGYTAAFEAEGPASLEMLELLPTRPPDPGFRDAGIHGAEVIRATRLLHRELAILFASR